MLQKVLVVTHVHARVCTLTLRATLPVHWQVTQVVHGLAVGKMYVFKVTTRQIDGSWADYTTTSVPVAPVAPPRAKGALALDPSQAERDRRRAELLQLDTPMTTNTSPQKLSKQLFESAEAAAAAVKAEADEEFKRKEDKVELAKWAAEQKRTSAAQRREKELADAAIQGKLKQEAEAELQRVELEKKARWAETARVERLQTMEAESAPYDYL